MTTLSTRHRITAVLAPIAALARSRARAQDGTGGPDGTQPPAFDPDIPWPVPEWPVDSPENHGFPADLVSQIDQRVAQSTPLLTSLLVVRNGHLVVDRHYQGFDPSQPFHIWSVTKSVTSIATGVAFGEGLLTSLDQTIGELIPERIPPDVDPRVPGITLFHLLTSTSGWAWDGRSNFSRHGETDNLELMLRRPLAFDPGAGFEYDSTNSNLLSYVIQAQSGETMAEFLQPRLFDPLGISPPEWFSMAQGETRGAGGLHLVPEDLARIGLLLLRDGVWLDRQIIEPDWIASSFLPHASGASAATGINIGGGGAYGYQWWIKESLGTVYGNGYGGQTLYLAPELDLVVVTAVAGTTVDRPDLQQPVLPVIEDIILPLAG